MPSRPDLSFAGLDDSVYKTKVSETETSISKTSKDIVEKPKTVRPSAPIIEDWDTDSDNDSVFRPKTDQTKPKFTKINFVKSDENVKSVNKENTHKQVEYPRKSQSPRGNRRNWNGMMTQKLGNGFEFIKKACFVCGSFNHLIKDCDFHDNKMVEKPVLNNKGRVTGQREIRPVWNNVQRVNHQNKLTHPHPKRNFVPTAVATKLGQVPVNAAKQNSPRAATSISTARPVNTAAPKSKVNDALPKTYSYFKAHSLLVLLWDMGKMLLSPQHAGFGDQQEMLLTIPPKTDQGIFGSGCSRHMTGNKSFLIDYQDVDGVFVAFAGSPKGCKISGKGKIRIWKLEFEDVYFVKELKFNLFSVSQMYDKKNNVLFIETGCLVLSPDFKLLDESQVLLEVSKQNMYSFDLKNVVPLGGLTCLFAEATIDESNLWHRRLGHINFKTMNKLVKGNLISRTQSVETLNESFPQGADSGSGPRINLLLPVLVYAARHTLTAVRPKLMLLGITCYCWIQALVDKKKVIITETSIRSDLKLDDAEGTDCLPTATIFVELERIGAKTTSKYIFDNMVKNLEGGVKFFMYPRKVTPLFETMMVQDTEDMGEDSAAHTDSHSTPTHTQPSSSKPQKKNSRRKQRKDSGPIEPIPDEAINKEHVATPSYDPPQSGEDRMQLTELMDLYFKDFDGGYVTFGGGAHGGRITGTEKFQENLHIGVLRRIIQSERRNGLKVAINLESLTQSDEYMLPVCAGKSSNDFVEAQIEDKDELHDEDDAIEESHDGRNLKANGTADLQVNTARPDINTGSREVSTALPEVNTATPKDWTQPSIGLQSPTEKDKEFYQSRKEYVHDNLENVQLLQCEVYCLYSNRFGKAFGSEEMLLRGSFIQVNNFRMRNSHLLCLTKKPSCLQFLLSKQFWRSAEASTDDNGDVQITATIDGHSIITSSPLPSPSPSPQHSPEPSPQHSLEHTTAAPTQPSPTQPSPRAKHHFPTPYDLPLHAVHSHGSDEGSLKLHELTNWLPNFPDSSEKGSAEVSSAGATKGTASKVPVVSTAEEDISTARRTVTYTRRSAEKRSRQDKGKSIMIESEPKKKSKKELEQERLSFAEAIRLEEQMNEEQRAHIARDEEIARQWNKEERQRAMAEAKSTKKIDWNDPSVIRYIPREDVAEDVESLSTKYPIVDWKTYTLTENFMYYQIFRGDGRSKNYKVLSEMLEDFNRQDVEELYRLVKERYSASRPEGYDLMLWGDLHTLFEPDEEDEIWKNQHEYNVIS
ncbi:ribonuclease H-like domain-containing protein [Tanacetum coccineum]